MAPGLAPAHRRKSHDPLLAAAHRPHAHASAGTLRRPRCAEAQTRHRKMSAPLLNMDTVTVQFGGLKAVCDFSFAIEGGELVGLIGPNGAGKTTVFNLVTGVYR